MKEIMVIKDEQAIDEWNRTIAQFIDVDNKIYKAEFIKVPENWEELKTMCEELESQTSDVTCDVLEDEIEVTIWNIDRSYKVGFAKFYYDGDKVHLFMGTGFSIPIEIPKVWSFIKSLIGEE